MKRQTTHKWQRIPDKMDRGKIKSWKDESQRDFETKSKGKKDEDEKKWEHTLRHMSTVIFLRRPLIVNILLEFLESEGRFPPGWAS